MNLNKHIPKSLFGSMIPVALFVTGLAFCVVIRLINIYGMVVCSAGDLNYFISKSYIGLNYVQLCVLVFSGFIVLGLLTLIRCKGKMVSIALIVSCLSICTNVLLLKAGVRRAHMDGMMMREESILSKNDRYSRRSLFISESLKSSVDQWNDVEDEKYEPSVEPVSIIGTWDLANGEAYGTCRFFSRSGYFMDVVWAFDGRVTEGYYRTGSVNITEDQYEIYLGDYAGFGSSAKPPFEGFEEGFYLELNRNQTSFMLYEDKTKTGFSLGPFVRRE